jgi:hypothetical protein
MPTREWITLLLGVSLTFGSAMVAPRAAAEPAARPTPQPSRSALEDGARQALRDAHADGFIQVRDVRSGDLLVHVTGSADGAGSPLTADSLVAPLSVIKVFVAASWIEHGLGDERVECRPSGGVPLRHMLVEEVLSSGCDSAGAQMATTLRRRLGAAPLLAEWRRDGLTHQTLRPDATDEVWGFVLSLGESDVPVTPRELSGFLRALGHGGAGLVSASTAHRLVRALEGVVTHGTASSIKRALAGTGWRIGGKTGTGPGMCGDQCDGWFAGLVSDAEAPRYVVLVFIRHQGLGGGVAAHLAASMAAALAKDR